MKHCQYAGPKRSAGRVKIGKRHFTAHKCSPKTPQQKRLAKAARACAGTGKIGGKARNACLRKHL